MCVDVCPILVAHALINYYQGLPELQDVWQQMRQSGIVGTCINVKGLVYTETPKAIRLVLTLSRSARKVVQRNK